MKPLIGCVFIVASLMASLAEAQFGVPWSYTPTVTVFSSVLTSRACFP